MSVVPPNGCTYCGVHKIDHGRRWHVEQGWHSYDYPTHEQRRTRWKEFVDAREANRRQQLIVDTLYGLRMIFTTNLVQELDPVQEAEMIRLLALGEKWTRGEL